MVERNDRDSVPLHVRLRQQMASLAARNGGPGGKFMSVRALARQYQVGVPTVMKALRQLKAEGILISRPGLGTFIVSPARAGGVAGCAGLVVSSASMIHFDRVYMTILSGIYEELSAARYLAQLINTGARDAALVREVRQARLDGVIWINPAEFCGSSLQALRQAGVKTVRVDLGVKDNAACSVSADLFDEGRRAAEYLVRRGHRRIALAEKSPAAARGVELEMRGFMSALRARRLRLDEGLIFSGDDFNARLETALDLKAPFTAVCVSGPLYESVLATLRRKKRRVPADIALLTEDDHFTMDCAAPVPTRLARPLRELGRTAVRKLLEWVRTGRQPPAQALPWEIIEGETV